MVIRWQQFLFSVFLLIGALFFVSSVQATPETLWNEHRIISHPTLNYGVTPGQTAPGRIWLPEEVTNGSYPIVIYLHGKNDGRRTLYGPTEGGVPSRQYDRFLKNQIARKQLSPAIFVSPFHEAHVKPTENFTTFGFTLPDLLGKVERLVQEKIPQVSIDRNKIVVVGHSNGAIRPNASLHKIADDNPGLFGLVNADGGFDPGLATSIKKNGAKNVVGLSARYPRHDRIAESWKRIVIGDERDYTPCDTALFRECKKSASKNYYFFRTVEDSWKKHSETVPIFYRNYLQLILPGGNFTPGQTSAVSSITPQTFQQSQPKTDTQIREEVRSVFRFPDLKITIPGLSFSEESFLDRAIKKEGDIWYIYIPFVGEYLQAIYRYGMGILGLIAVIVIIVSGMQWSVSRGESDVISSAKSRIGKAIIGLLLGICSYILLYLIHPSLLEFNSLRIQYVVEKDLGQFNEDVQPVSFDQIIGKIENADYVSVPSSAAAPSGVGQNGIPIFKQGDPRWRKLGYGNGGLPVCEGRDNNGPDTATCCTVMGYSACGPTAVAMVLRAVGLEVDPRHTSVVAVQSEARVCNKGTNLIDHRFRAAVEKTFNVKYELINHLTDRNPQERLNRILSYLQNGKPLISDGPQIGYEDNGTKNEHKGHYYVYTGVGKKNHLGGPEVDVVWINDPARKSTYVLMSDFEKKVFQGVAFVYITKK